MMALSAQKDRSEPAEPPNESAQPLNLNLASNRAEVEADLLIEAVTKHFVPSVSAPAPMWLFHQRPELRPFPVDSAEIFDLAAVAAGIKPAALLSAEEAPSTPCGKELLRRAIEKGLTAATSTAPGSMEHPILFVGESNSVRALSEVWHVFKTGLMEESEGLDATVRPEALHRRIGELLGYPTAAIDAYLKSAYGG